MLPEVAASDTAPETERLRLELLRSWSPAEKAARVSALTAAACHWSLAGLRQRHPGASTWELMLRLTVLRLGAETVRRVYGWSADDGA